MSIHVLSNNNDKCVAFIEGELFFLIIVIDHSL